MARATTWLEISSEQEVPQSRDVTRQPAQRAADTHNVAKSRQKSHLGADENGRHTGRFISTGSVRRASDVVAHEPATPPALPTDAEVQAAANILAGFVGREYIDLRARLLAGGARTSKEANELVNKLGDLYAELNGEQREALGLLIKYQNRAVGQ